MYGYATFDLKARHIDQVFRIQVATPVGYEADPDAFSKDALEAEAVEKARLEALERAKAYRSR